VNKEVLAELERRIKKIRIDGVLDTNYITELIKDAPYSPVKQSELPSGRMSSLQSCLKAELLYSWMGVR
jgi:bifunctional DNase/RNase